MFSSSTVRRARLYSDDRGGVRVKGSLTEPDPLPDRYAGKGFGLIPISFCKPHVAWGC